MKSTNRANYLFPAAARKRRAILPESRSHTGSTLVVVIIVLLVITIVGLALADVTSRDMRNSYSNWQREQALAAAEGGVDYAIWWLSNTAYTSQTTSNSNALYGFIPSSGTALVASDPGTNLSMPAPPQGSGVPFKVGVYDGSYYPTGGAWPGDKVLVCTSIQGNETVSVQVVVQNNGQNIFPWNNALFAGGSQASGTTTNASIHGPVDILGNGITSSTAALSFAGGSNSGIFDNYSDGLTPPTFWVSGQDNKSGSVTPPSENGGPVYASTSTDLPALFTDSSSSLTLDSTLRVANGTVNIPSGSVVGLADHISGADSTMDGVYVTDGFTSGSAARVTSDNGTIKADTANVPRPSLTDNAAGLPAGHLPETQIKWDQDLTNPNVLVVPATYLDSGTTLTLGRDIDNQFGKYTYPHPSVTIGSYPAGPYLKQTWVDPNEAGDNHEDYFNLEIKGIIYVPGDVVIGDNHAGAHGGVDIITYSGTGTIVAGTVAGVNPVYGVSSNNIDCYAQLIAAGSASTGAGFVGADDSSTSPLPPAVRNVLGLVASGDAFIHDSHLSVGQGRLMAALYAENNLSFEDQTAFFGAAVARNNFTLSGQPDLNFVPELPLHLPPGLPGTAPYNVGGVSVVNYQQVQ